MVIASCCSIVILCGYRGVTLSELIRMLDVRTVYGCFVQ